MIGIACTEELVRTGSLSMASLAPYGQMLYWVFLWGMVAVLCRRRVKADLLLRGLALGAIATAISVLLGFAFGTKQYYGADAVISSAGWFDTAKMITGILITGGVVLIYLGRKGNTFLCAPAGFAMLHGVHFDLCARRLGRGGGCLVLACPLGGIICSRTPKPPVGWFPS